ncbi:MAG: hypothetical protein IKA31_05380 [Clostridia bacterium]|nr:hypothetical protein [Clostridia bacterium]
MSGLKLKVSDFESFLNKIGLKLGDSYNDFEFNALTDNLLNSNKMFEIILSNEKQHSLIKVKINERELFLNNTDISKLWQKHLYNIYVKNIMII